MKKEKTLYRDVIKQFAGRVSYPVYYYPNFGHSKTNMPFILNNQVNILCHGTQQLCNLTQPPVNIFEHKDKGKKSMKIWTSPDN